MTEVWLVVRDHEDSPGLSEGGAVYLYGVYTTPEAAFAAEQEVTPYGSGHPNPAYTIVRDVQSWPDDERLVIADGGRR